MNKHPDLGKLVKHPNLMDDQEIFDVGLAIMGWQGGTIWQVQRALADMLRQQGISVDERPLNLESFLESVYGLVVHEQIRRMMITLRRIMVMGENKRKRKASEADGSGQDVLDDIILAPAVVESWHQKAIEAVKRLSDSGHEKTDIGLETAYVKNDGSLLLRVEVKGGQPITMRVAPGQWGYKS